MNLKRFSIILMLLSIFLLSISVISANEDVNKTLCEANNMDLKENIAETPIYANESTIDTKTTRNTNDSATSQNNKTSPIKTKVSAPEVSKVYKKKGTFKITVKDSNKKPVKKLKLNVKVYTGMKSKTFKIKTNSKGITTLNTKNLKIGNHKVLITSADKSYNVNKKSCIYIGKKKTLTLRLNQQKTFKNGDYFRFFKETKNAQYEKGVYVDNLRVHKGNLEGAKNYHIIKVKYTFKNIKGMTITKVSTTHNMFKTKLIIGYEPVSAKVTYIQS